MSWSLHIIAFSSVAAYLLASLGYLRSLWSRHGETARYLLIFGALAHGLFLLLGLRSEVQAPISSYSLSLISLGLVLSFLIFCSGPKLRALGVFVAPLGFGFLVVSGWIFHASLGQDQVDISNSVVKFHVASTLLGNIFFGLACVVSLALILQERLLKQKKLHTLSSKMPSLNVLDGLHFRVLGFGFFLMALGVISGVLLLSGEASYLDPRLLVSGATLFLYAILLGARVFRGFRGRRAAWLTVAGFFLAMLSSLTLKFSESFHVH